MRSSTTRKSTRLLTALGVTCVCASTAVALSAASATAPPAKPAAAVVSYSGCLERIARNHDAFVLANATRNVAGQPPHGYNVLSNESLRLEPQADGKVDFSTWEGYVVVAEGTLDRHAPRPKDPLFRSPWGERFASLPVLTVTAYQHLAGTLPCPA